MSLSPKQRHALLAADRTRDVRVVAAIIADVLAANPDVNLFDVETAFRDGACATYLVVTADRFEVVIGMPAMLAAVAAAGMTPEQNRMALAASRKVFVA